MQRTPSIEPLTRVGFASSSAAGNRSLPSVLDCRLADKPASVLPALLAVRFQDSVGERSAHAAGSSRLHPLEHPVTRFIGLSAVVDGSFQPPAGIAMTATIRQQNLSRLGRRPSQTPRSPAERALGGTYDRGARTGRPPPT